MKQEKKSLGEKLRELREDYDLTQEQVAAVLNVNRTTYTKYELNNSHPSLDSLVKLAHIFNVPKETLLPDDDSDAPSFKEIKRPDSMLKSLNKDERGLIAAYRALDKEQKAELKRQIAKLSKK